MQEAIKEPVLDSNCQPVEGTRHYEDSDGVRLRCRLWRGFHVTDFEGAERRLDSLAATFRPRPDDVLICAYLKCGTHWLHDICHFLLTRQCSERPANKENFMLEFKEHVSMEAWPGPRVLNCHLPLPALPSQLTSGPTKIVYAVRNPKDVAVSLYHHCISIADYNYRSNFHAFLSGLFEAGKLDGGSYFEHTRGYLAAIESGELTVGSKLHLVEFEQLKANTAAEIRRLDEFLRADGQPAVSEELLVGICERVGFEQMRQDRGNDMGHLFAASGAMGGFYRKGGVGGWRSCFDEDASARIDKLVEQHLGQFAHLYRPKYDI